MVNQKWKKLTALALSILMVTGTFTEWLPTALAAGESPPAPEQASTYDTGGSDPAAPGGTTGGSTTGTGGTTGGGTGSGDLDDGPPAKQLDFQDGDNGRPNLYVDFLGDNMRFVPRGQGPLTAGALAEPATYDQSRLSNPTVPDNSWEGYQLSHVSDTEQPIFWVGVGVDRVQVWELLKSGNLSSLELGFYYNNTYIEPYQGVDYRATLEAVNLLKEDGSNKIGDGSNQWSESIYKILHAETGLPVQMDLVTQETLREPSLEEIASNTAAGDTPADWKMTYVSLEMKNPGEVLGIGRKLEGAYNPPVDAGGDPVVPQAASGENGPVYLLYIPFQLKQYDPLQRLCLRLIRNATHFSIGGGRDGSVDYAAWERTTVRNPGKDLKLQTRFTGDLNIFRGNKADKDREVSYTAQLRFLNGGGAENAARLSVQGDTGVTPVWVDTDGHAISGLQGGTGMQVDLHVQEGYTATVRVVYTDGLEDGVPKEYYWTYTTVKDQEQYTFVMPEHDAIVYVTIQGGDNTNFSLYLSEIPKPDSADYKLGNETTVTAGGDSINSFDPRASHPDDGHGEGPKMIVATETTVTVSVETHADCQAELYIHNFRTDDKLADGITFTGIGSVQDGVITLPFGGTVTFDMPQSDVDVVVKFTAGSTSTATLQVWHDGDAARAVTPMNVAQLAYTKFGGDGSVTTGYSGQVYEDANIQITADPASLRQRHEAVRNPSQKTPWVPMSATTVSGSLGGDGKVGKTWIVPGVAGADADMINGPRAVMTELANATQSDLMGRFSALDLASAVLFHHDASHPTAPSQPVTGMRKDLDGNPYGDEDLQDMATLLWEIRTKVEQDATLAATYIQEVPLSATDSTVAYRYFDLTPAQVQAYLLATLELDQLHRDNVAAYREVYTLYQTALDQYEKVHAVEMTTTATAPIAPIQPDAEVSELDGVTGARTYQGGDYVTAYIDSYKAYITQYQSYIDTVVSPVVQYEDTPGAVFPVDVPDRVTLELPTADQAETQVSAAAATYGWEETQLPADPAPTAAITTRTSREVFILLEADSAYEVASVSLRDMEGNPLLPNTVQPVASTSYKNVYSFHMPEQDCMVQVHYALRSKRDMEWSVRGADGVEDNVAYIHAYQVTSPADVKPTLVTVTNDGSQDEPIYGGTVERTLVGSTVNMEVKCDSGYNVTVSVTNGPGGAPVRVTDNGNGTHTFVYPEPPAGSADGEKVPVVVTITYTKKGLTNHNAHIILRHFDENYADENTALWDIGASTMTATVGEALTGVISLKAGYYIYTTYAYGASDGYPHTLTGDGYNNGLGCLQTGLPTDRDPVYLNITMPDEDLYVYVYVRKGIPPEEQVHTLTVIATDLSNTGSAPVDNWVKAAVYKREDNTALRAALPYVGLGASGGGEMRYHYIGDADKDEGILAGDKVVVDLNAVEAAGYYVSSVVIEPTHLGTSMQWLPTDLATDPNRRQLTFTMPAGSTTVDVTFEKKVESFPTYFIYARKLEVDRNNQQILNHNQVPDNRILTAQSNTMKRYSDNGVYTVAAGSPNPVQVPKPVGGVGGGAGLAGERVTMTFQAAKGWYVQSVLVLTDGAARPAPFTLLTGKNDGSGGTFTADLVMPAGDARFTVNYRQCPDDPDNPGGFLPHPEVPEYAVTLRIIDDDNRSLPRARNSLTASFSSSIDSHQNDHAPISVNAYDTGKDATTAVQYIHAGDHVRLSYTLDPDYTMEYILVSPASLGIDPTYLRDKENQFTMPAENITVVARVVKGTRHPYTANLILRPPAGLTTEDMATVGWGTFTNDGGSLTDYAENAIYSLLLYPGAHVGMDLFAFDGYYIDRITVQPAHGATATLSGAFGSQHGGFTMPICDVTVNVWFKAGWPDETPYDLTLKVYDSSFDLPAEVGQQANYLNNYPNYAHFDTVSGTVLSSGDKARVYGGQVHTVTGKVRDGREVVVALHTDADTFYDSTSLFITDSEGHAIPWRLVPGGIAFAMPPRATTVEVTFLRKADETPRRSTRTATLHVEGNDANNAIVILQDARNNRVNRDGGKLTQLQLHETVDLRVDLNQCNPAMVVREVYAVDSVTGQQLLIPTGGDVDGLTITNARFSVPELAIGRVDTGIHVYVKLETPGADQVVNPAMKLLVTGPVGSGSATLAEVNPYLVNEVTVPAGQGDSIRAAHNQELLLTLNPASGYELVRITITDGHGADVSYEWLGLLQDPAFEPTRWYQDEGWSPNPEQQITLQMPPDGGTIRVDYAKVPQPDPPGPDEPDPEPYRYTAQIVVNDEQFAGGKNDPRNDAKLWTEHLFDVGTGSFVLDENSNPVPDLRRLLTAKAGEWVNIAITVQAGYRIMPVVVVPQSYGIKPQLYLGDLDSQTTGFRMPAGDVTVYVTFVRDGLQRYNATLEVNGPAGAVQDDNVGANRGTIRSDYTGAKGPIDSTDPSVSVQAAARREWVTVTYTWDDTKYYPQSVTVEDWLGRAVPFTQVSPTELALPMVTKDIVITVTYENRNVTPPPEPGPIPPEGPFPDPEPKGVPVVLHVIDASTGQDITSESQGYGQLTYDYVDETTGAPASLTTGQVAPKPKEGPYYDGTDATWGNMAALKVPAGKLVTLTAFSDQTSGVYIESAYVLYREGGQMISCNLTPNNQDGTNPGATPGFYDTRSAVFETHLGRNDVYVYLIRSDTPPASNQYSATLMLKGDPTDIGSTASISVGEDVQNPDGDRWATVHVNPGDHGKVNAARGETIRVTVNPMEGYDIDYILVTPLGVPIAPQRLNKTYTFTMPGYNVSICVYLKRSNAREYTAAIHYAQRSSDLTAYPGTNNKASITYAPEDQLARVAVADQSTDPDNPNFILVTEGETVTLNVTLDAPYTVLAAYALQDGAIVPLSPALEGITETASVINNDLADGTATFTMPAGNVDVYVVTTDTPPTGGPWYTAVLTVRDPDNSGQNAGTILRDATIEGTAQDLPGPTSRVVNSALPNQGFLTVRQGQVVTVRVRAAAPGYVFSWPAVLSHSGIYSETLHPVSTSSSYYVYNFTVGNCNSAVLADFKNAVAKENPLNVVIEDRDNPGQVGDGRVENKVTVSVTDSEGKPDLELVSTSPAGAFQAIPNVEERSTITVTATAHPGYRAYANFFDGEEDRTVPLTANGNVYTGTCEMPAVPAQVTITFYKTYTATLIMQDRSIGDQSNQAEMRAYLPVKVEFPIPEVKTQQIGPITVNQTSHNRDSITDLSRDTKLVTRVLAEPTSQVLAVLRTDATGTDFIRDYTEEAETGARNYGYTIDRSDVTITVIMDRKAPDPTNPSRKPGHVAAVETVNKPAEAANPTLAVSPVPNPHRSGAIWTDADTGAQVTVQAAVPAGYTVEAVWTELKETGETTETLTLTESPADSRSWTGTGVMPDANVKITLTYRKTPSLTLRVVEPLAIAGGTRTNVSSPAIPTALTASGDTRTVNAGSAVTVAAGAGTPIPVPGSSPAETYQVYVREIVWQDDTQVEHLYTNPGEELGDQTKTFDMPAADTVVTVVYGVKPTGTDPGPGPDPGPDDPDPRYYTAWVTTQGRDNRPENAVTGIVNLSDPGVYPENSPYWASGAAERDTHPSVMHMTLTTHGDYTAVVTATTKSGGAFVPVIQQGYSGNCTAQFHMPPDSAPDDVLVTVTYYGPDEDGPDVDLEDVTLVLVGHDKQAGNNAETAGGSLSSLALTGANGTPIYASEAVSPVYKQELQKVEGGAELRLTANWTSGYRIVRATLSIPKTDAPAPDGADGLDPDNGSYVATELPLSKYGSTATSRFNMPQEKAIVTVYYENIYTVTLNVTGATHGYNGDEISTSDSRGVQTVTSTGVSPIHYDHNRLLELRGGESIQTVAAADTPNSGNRLVGVVWESALTGARHTVVPGTETPAIPVSQNNRYDFEMPQANVDLYAVFQKDPDKEEDKGYIAKVALAEDSAPYGNGNSIQIRNTTDANTARGQFWTVAKAKDDVEITVGLRPGCQAIITAAQVDDPNHPVKALPHVPGEENFDFYVNRRVFVVSGLTSTFTMPAKTDATVTVRFIEGYDLTLEMTDETEEGQNIVETQVRQPTAAPEDAPVAVLAATSDERKKVTAENSELDTPENTGRSVTLEMTTVSAPGVTCNFSSSELKVYPIVQPTRSKEVRTDGAGNVVGNGVILEGIPRDTTMVAEVIFPAVTAVAVSNNKMEGYFRVSYLLEVEGQPTITITPGVDGKAAFPMPDGNATLKATVTAHQRPLPIREVKASTQSLKYGSGIVAFYTSANHNRYASLKNVAVDASAPAKVYVEITPAQGSQISGQVTAVTESGDSVTLTQEGTSNIYSFPADTAVAGEVVVVQCAFLGSGASEPTGNLSVELACHNGHNQGISGAKLEVDGETLTSGSVDQRMLTDRPVSQPLIATITLPDLSAVPPASNQVATGWIVTAIVNGVQVQPAQIGSSNQYKCTVNLQPGYNSLRVEITPKYANTHSITVRLVNFENGQSITLGAERGIGGSKTVSVDTDGQVLSGVVTRDSVTVSTGDSDFIATLSYTTAGGQTVPIPGQVMKGSPATFTMHDGDITLTVTRQRPSLNVSFQAKDESGKAIPNTSVQIIPTSISGTVPTLANGGTHTFPDLTTNETVTVRVRLPQPENIPTQTGWRAVDITAIVNLNGSAVPFNANTGVSEFSLPAGENNLTISIQYTLQRVNRKATLRFSNCNVTLESLDTRETIATDGAEMDVIIEGRIELTATAVPGYEGGFEGKHYPTSDPSQVTPLSFTGGAATFFMPPEDTTVEITGKSTASGYSARAMMAPAQLFAMVGSHDAATTVHGLESGLSVTSDVSVFEEGTDVWVTRWTQLTGTEAVNAGTGEDYKYLMPEEDVVQSVLFRNANDPDNLLAKVQVRGETSINGNTADPIVDTSGTTTRVGAVWTTTAAGNTVDLSLTVANGYQAKLRVVRDDSMRDADGNLRPESEWEFLDAKEYGFQVDHHGDAGVTTYPSSGITEITVGFYANTDNQVTGSDVSRTQNFQFNVPVAKGAVGNPGDAGYQAAKPETDVTVLVEFEYAGLMPAPYDPRNDGDKTPAFLKPGFIYAESRGSYAIVEVPTLERSEILYDTDNYGEADGEGNKRPETKVKFKFYLLNHANGVYTQLLPNKDIILEPYDPETLRTKDDPATTVNEADPYNYSQDMWTDGTGRRYVSSKFKLTLAPQSGASTNQYQSLVRMLDSDGSLTKVGETYKTSLYIVAEDAVGNESNYTQVWIRPCYTLAARVISYAPRHPLDAALYALNAMPANLPAAEQAAWPMDIANYAADPAFTDRVEPVSWGTDKWQQMVKVRSSELLGGYDSSYDPENPRGSQTPTYAMVLQKAANLTYTRVDIQLNTTEANANYYDAATHTYSIQDAVPITLVAGDVDEDGAVKWQDQDMLMNFLFRSAKWTRLSQAPTAPAAGSDATVQAQYEADLADWAVSVYNPASLAYRCDLDGDQALSVADWNVMLAKGNYNYSVENYNWETTAVGRDGQTAYVLPHGLCRDPGVASLMSGAWEEGPAPFDALRDTPLTQDELAALGDAIYDPDHPPVPDAALRPDSAGAIRPALPQVPATPGRPGEELRPEVPLGDEVHPAP